MKVVATSDIHGQLPVIPECDLCIIAGDVCPIINHDKGYQQMWLKDTFVPYLKQIPSKHTAWIGGNHDFALDQYHWLAKEMKQYGYIQDEGYYHWFAKDDLPSGSTDPCHQSLYGTPWVPRLRNWAFYAEGKKAEDIFENIPFDLDILISHGPPFGYSDRESWCGHVGSQELLDMCKIAKPKIIISGHIHEGYGEYETSWGGKLYNVSHNNEYYEPVNPPLEITVELSTLIDDGD